MTPSPKTLALCALLLPGAGNAQELIFDPAHTLDCIAVGMPFESCVGNSAQACMDFSEGGYSTVVMGGCLDREATLWDERLNSAYARAMDRAGEGDAGNGDMAPSQVDALRDMQRAWIAYRDATCSFEASKWGGGTGASPAFLDCFLHQTALQTRYLEAQNLGE